MDSELNPTHNNATLHYTMWCTAGRGQLINPGWTRCLSSCNPNYNKMLLLPNEIREFLEANTIF